VTTLNARKPAASGRPVALSELDGAFQLDHSWLMALNQALRRINFGQWESLPYHEPRPGFVLAMRAELIPHGPGRPPGLGPWQLEIAPVGQPYVLRLEGRQSNGIDMGELFLCPETRDGPKTPAGDNAE